MEDSGNTSDESTSSSKRQKISGDSGNTDEGLDRISVLPDSVLLYILSLLPTKEAIKTGILSKRWAYLWTSVPNLDFSDPNFEESEDEDGFVNFVDRTLILYGGSRIKRFRVVFEYREWFASRVDLWIRFAARKNVEELILEFAEGDNLDPLDGDPYLLPQHVLTNGSVTNLSFSFCRINPHGSISWRSLKSLSLSYMPLNDNLVHDIITGSPSLEVLDLYECCGLRKLNITSENLKKLTLRDYYSSSDLNSALEISAPNIQSLSILGILNRRCHLMNMPSLIDATLQFQIMIDNILDEYNVYEGYHNILRVILETLQHVKVLRIGIWCIQVLSIWEMKILPSPSSKRKLLMLDTSLDKWELPGIANLLRSSPDLEALVVNMTASSFINQFHFEADFLDSYNFDGERYWSSQNLFLHCLMHNLKTVKINGFTGGCHEIELVQFILKNAMVLEKMVIYTPRYAHLNWRKRFSPEELLEIAQKMLSFQRASPRAVILFS